MQKFQRYFEAVQYIEQFKRMAKGKDYMKPEKDPSIYLKRMRYFLDLVGSPDKNMKFIHITGTSGKGTVTTMLHNVLHLSGKNVGSFTSPAVTTSIEKICVGKKYISPKEFVNIVEQLKSKIEYAKIHCPYGGPSYFEIFLAIALIYFKRMGCELVILEVGCGGRHDATNVIQNPLITVITNIDYDHIDIFGKSLKNIAEEKMGIIKKGSTFFTTEQRPNLIRMFKQTCKKVGADFIRIKEQRNHNEYNKILVTKIAHKLHVSHGYTIKGIRQTHLQCRFETIQKNPLIILDGAHNRAKMKSTIYNLQQLKYKKVHVILGILATKDYAAIVKEIAPFADSLYLTAFDAHEKSCVEPTKLFKQAKQYINKSANILLFQDSNTALKQAQKNVRGNDVLLITGSFVLAGELRKMWHPEIEILTKRKAF